MTLQGAEAEVEIGEENVTKTRKEKRYRHPELDRRIREERTSEELKNIQRARKYSTEIPETEQIDETTLRQGKIDGKQLKEVIKDRTDLIKELGKNVANMHSADVIHGDLTTSNVLISGKNKIYLIDLGLSQVSERIEDKAVDIHLLKQVLNSSHPGVADEAWEEFLKGYRDYEEGEKVMNRLKEVESRGRYK